MSFILPGREVCSCPAKGRGVCLSTLISTTGRHASKKSASKSHMREPLIVKHPVVSRESLCKRGVQASADTPLRSPLNSLFAQSGAIIHRPARVIKSIGAVLCDRTCPLRLATMLDTTMCEVKTWWKLQSCVRSAKSVVKD
jgi:hypothetical protein